MTIYSYGMSTRRRRTVAQELAVVGKDALVCGLTAFCALVGLKAVLFFASFLGRF